MSDTTTQAQAEWREAIAAASPRYPSVQVERVKKAGDVLVAELDRLRGERDEAERNVDLLRGGYEVTLGELAEALAKRGSRNWKKHAEQLAADLAVARAELERLQ